MTFDADLYLKYYRAPRCGANCVKIVLVELRCTDCTNNSLFEITYIYKDFNGGYMCVLIVRVQNCECLIQKCGY